MSVGKMDRRTFLTVAGASGAALAVGCGSEEAPPPVAYPQGVGSGDPSPDSIVLWTRVEPREAGADVVVRWEIARDEAFADVVAMGETTAVADADHTVRVRVGALTAATRYWYRFEAEGVESTIGRTRTAPAMDADVAVRFALASCQDYGGRWYHAWRVLADEPEVDFVLFLGDYIYETIGHLGRVPEGRRVEIPEGLELDDPLKGDKTALTLGDYRALYRQYRSDPDLQRIHALYPFVVVWDDHEFANDSWGDHAIDFDGRRGDEPSPDRRAAATRAWFEYQALDLAYRPEAGFPNDLRMWRPFHWGRHAGIAITDQRYFRDDHVIPEGPADAEVGKILENSALGSRTFAIKDVFDVREAAVRPTMLGAEQRAWLVDYLTTSTSTWKLWASPLVVAPLVLDLREYDIPEMFRNRFYFKLDQWDGYRSERAEILGALAGVSNLAVLSGDIHAFSAAEIRVDFDMAATPAIAVEYTVGAISSPTVEEQLVAVVRASPLLDGIGIGDLIPQFDTNALAANPHLRHSESTRCGVAVVELDAAEMRVEFLQTTPPVSETFDGDVRRIAFRTPAGSPVVETS